MSAFFSTLSCCWFWLILGILIGWLLNRWLCKCCSNSNHSDPNPVTKSATSPPAKTPDISTSAAAPSAAKIEEKSITVPKADSKPIEKIVSSTTIVDTAAAKAAGFSIKNTNDLTVIEGIGPKINALFNNNGINTFAELSVKTVPQLRAILDTGGSRYRMANPSTWAKQAELASVNKWTELKKLQDELSGGVKK